MNRQLEINAAVHRNRRARMKDEGFVHKRVYVHRDDVLRFEDFIKTLRKPEAHVPDHRDKH